GASHVLALSGLHVGLIYGLLWFLFTPLWKHKRYLKIPLIGFILFSLWSFAFFTGFSISVVRAVLMCSLFLLLSFRAEPVLSTDTLLATAFFMLFCAPHWLFDVGFQLSFSAVFAILIIQPRLYALIQVRSCCLRKIWGLLTVSIAAQLGTAPLVLFYFKHFSTHFLLTNLWVIPLVMLVMY
ncbi:competence protein, partial [gut metagenome]